MPKDFGLTNLYKDLGYTIYGTEAHQLLFSLLPPAQGVRVLEPGCGCGKFGLSYALQGGIVTMLDFDPEVVLYAKMLLRALDALRETRLLASIHQGNIHCMSYPDGLFDLVFNEGVPQHWPDEERRQGAIDAMARVSRNLVVVIGNNGANPREAEEDRTRTFGYKGMPSGRKCFTPDELKMRLKRAGLNLVEVQPVTPGPLEDSYLLAGWGYK